MKQNYISISGDTNSEMQEVQNSIIMAKTPEERFRMGLEMMETGRNMMIAGIRSEKPGLSEDEYIIEYIKRSIAHDQSLQWLNDILKGD